VGKLTDTMREGPDGSTAVEVRDLWLSFGEATVLEAINLVVPRNDFLGIIGPNGAGKTALLKVLLGLLTPQRGTVEVLGMSPRRARGRVGYVPQHAEFDKGFPVRVIDVVRMGLLGRTAEGEATNREPRELVHEALERVGLVDLGRRQIGRLSGGQLQRVLIARALVTDPPLLLLDEPTSNLDSHSSATLYELLEKLSERHTVLMVDHDVGVMHRHVRNVACLNRRLHYHRPVDELSQEALEKTYGYPVDIVVHAHTHRVLEPHKEPPRE